LGRGGEGGGQDGEDKKIKNPETVCFCFGALHVFSDLGTEF